MTDSLASPAAADRAWQEYVAALDAALRDSIREHDTDTGGKIVRAGGSTTTRQSESGPYDYARAQEFGREDMQPSPYFWPAYRLLKKKFVSRRRRAVNQAIKESYGK